MKADRPRDWFLFHMTPLGMELPAERSGNTDNHKAALVLVAGVLAVAMLIAAYLNV